MGIKKGASALWYSELGLHQLGSRPTVFIPRWTNTPLHSISSVCHPWGEPLRSPFLGEMTKVCYTSSLWIHPSCWYRIRSTANRPSCQNFSIYNGMKFNFKLPLEESLTLKFNPLSSIAASIFFPEYVASLSFTIVFHLTRR